VRDLLKAALIQSANDAADALAAHMGTGHFVALMNEKARELGLTDTHFVRPDGLDAPGHVSSARDVTLLARAAMRIRFVRDTVRERADTISGGRTIHTWNDLLSTFPHVLGVKTGHTNAAGWSQVAAVRGTGVTIYATLLGGPSRERRNEDLAALLAWGLARYRVVPVIDGARVYALAATPYGKGALSLVAAKPLVHVVRVDRPLVEQYVSYVAALLHGDLGLSIRTRRPVANDLADAVPATLELAFAALLVSLLVGLPGVGPKTAACVLLFSLDKPYFPVDTHVHRVAIRLGLVPPRASAVQTQQLLQAALAPAEMYEAHMNLIRHGRHVCVALRPMCSQCPLNDLCPKVGVVRSR
jgi:hypothetical protein